MICGRADARGISRERARGRSVSLEHGYGGDASSRRRSAGCSRNAQLRIIKKLRPGTINRITGKQNRGDECAQSTIAQALPLLRVNDTQAIVRNRVIERFLLSAKVHRLCPKYEITSETPNAMAFAVNPERPVA
jgi:hypothetical protein